MPGPRPESPCEVCRRSESALLRDLRDLDIGVSQKALGLEMAAVGQNVERGPPRDFTANAAEMRRRDPEKGRIVLNPLGLSKVAFDKRCVSLGQTMRGSIKPP